MLARPVRRFDLQLSPPVANPVIIQGFGVNLTGIPDFYTKYGLPFHEGLDYRAPTGTPILACADGHISRIERVEFEGSGGAYGIQVRINHLGDLYETVYAHLRSVTFGLAVGDPVMRGEEIGTSDSTGHSTAAHCHLTLKRRGNTAAGIKQRVGDGTWALYPSDIVDPTGFLVFGQ